MKLSASPFALGCSGVTLWCSNPISSANNLNSVKLNGGPLSNFFSLVFHVLQIFFLAYHMLSCMTLMLSAQQQENVSFCQSLIG